MSAAFSQNSFAQTAFSPLAFSYGGTLPPIVLAAPPRDFPITLSPFARMGIR